MKVDTKGIALPKEQETGLFSELDKGIEDFEAGKVLSHEEAMQRIRERLHSYGVSYRWDIKSFSYGV